MPLIETLGVEHVEFAVNDLAVSTAFYDKVLTALGFKRLGTSGYIGWSNALMTVGLRPVEAAEAGKRFNRYRVGLHHLAFKAKGRSDVEVFHRFLVENNVEILDAPAEYPQYGPGYYALFFADPDGIKLELAHFPWGFWRVTQTTGGDSRPRSG